jgi:signal peptidase I
VTGRNAPGPVLPLQMLERLSAFRREVVTVLVAAAVVLTARSSLADHYVVPTGSMIPTVEPRDHIFVDKLAYGLRVPLLDAYAVRFDDPAHGDVVVLRSPETGIVLLKRVVAVPGDEVKVTGGELALNGVVVPVSLRGSELVEQLGAVTHAVRLDNGGGPDFGPLRLPAGRFLVMGDNRGDSHDGRAFGLVTRSAIFGRAEGVFLREGAPTWIGL